MSGHSALLRERAAETLRRALRPALDLPHPAPAAAALAALADQITELATKTSEDSP